MENCLGLEWLGECSNYINNELSVFNIGVFLGVVGVFFAGYQLLFSIHKLRFKTRIMKWMYIFFIFPIISIYIATILPFIPGEAIPLIGYPITWEIITITYIIFIFFPFISFLIFKKITIFDNKNGKLNAIYISYIARNKDIDSLVNELGYFFSDFLKKYKEELKGNTWGFASQFIIILQNQRVIDLLVSNPIAIQTIVDNYKDDKRNQFTYDEQQFLQKVILGSFSDNNSFLVHELGGNMNIDNRNQNGIILRKIIEDLKFLEKLNILGDGKTYKYDKNPIFIENYLLFTMKIHEEFLSKDRLKINYKMHQLLFDVFKTQSSIIQTNYNKLSHLQLSSLLGFNFQYNLIELEKSLLELYGGNFPEIFLNLKAPYGGEYNFRHSNTSLIDAYAFGIYELFEAFSYHQDTREYTIDFDFFRNEEIILKEIEKRILLLFKQIIPENLNGHYAPVSRIFWDNYCWDILNTTKKINENDDIVGIVLLYASKLPRLSEGYIYAYTEETLKDQYKKEKALEKSREIIADLFPKYIDYDIENNLLNIYDPRRLSFKILDLGETLNKGNIIIIEH